MGKEIKSISLQKLDGLIISSCHFEYTREHVTTDSYDSPYDYEVLIHYIDNTDIITSIEILDGYKLAQAIENEDSFPELGLFNYKDDDLGIDLKDVSIREVYRELFNKMGLV